MTVQRLDGCTPTTISNYLKALGLFRIISQQKDGSVRARWNHERLEIDTILDKNEIIDFVQNYYEPSPIVSPWSYNKYQKTKESLKGMIMHGRFRKYKDILSGMSAVEEVFSRLLGAEMSKDTAKDNKPILLQLCRNMLPDDIVPWIDTVSVIDGDKPKFAPIMGRGGNDGNFDIAENFVKQLNSLLAPANSRNGKSKNMLEASLFGGTMTLVGMSMVGHNPDGCTSPVGDQSFKSKSMSNPWDFVLMMEGVVFFAGNLARRQSRGGGKAVFPFTTQASKAGYATATNDEDDLGEIWLPIWNNFATFREIRHVFNEGRVQLEGRQVETGTEFARAITRLGIERGISSFQRIVVVKRKGDAFLYTNSGRIYTTNEPAVHLLNELDKWYNPIQKTSKTPKATGVLKYLVRCYDESILRLCQYQKREHLLSVMSVVGRLDRYSISVDGAKPLKSLTTDWLKSCYDGTPEFRLATSMASIRTIGIPSIRENLEEVMYSQNRWEYKEKSPSYVWNENDYTLPNMVRVVYRRGIDGLRYTSQRIPINGAIPAKMTDVVKFLNGELDMKKIGDLVLPLSIIEIDARNPDYPWKNDICERIDNIPVPEAYALLKIVHSSERLEDIPYDMSMLAMLNAGRFKDAYARASNVLFAHGMRPKSHSKRTGIVNNVSCSDTVKKHLAASLLFSIHRDTRMELVKRFVDNT